MLTTHVVLKSSNSKTGPLATTYRTQSSCPTTCPLMGNGCYATGRIFGIPKKFGSESVDNVRALASKDVGAGIRFNVSGDFLAEDGTPDLDYIAACNEAADAHKGKVMISYTHAWRQLTPGMFTFTVNASCETEAEILEAQAAGWQTVIVNGDDGSRIGGRKVVTCLAETRGLSCADCGLCGADKPTRPVVSFTAHGAGKKRATAAVDGKR